MEEKGYIFKDDKPVYCDECPAFAQGDQEGKALCSVHYDYSNPTGSWVHEGGKMEMWGPATVTHNDKETTFKTSEQE